MDYKNGEIYCIRNNVDNDMYIGSTCSALSKRMSGHRTDMKLRPKTGSKLYQRMEEIGLDKFYIELLLEYPSENKEQLQAKEGEYMVTPRRAPPPPSPPPMVWSLSSKV